MRDRVINWTVPRLNNFRQNVQPEGEFAGSTPSSRPDSTRRGPQGHIALAAVWALDVLALTGDCQRF
jgi:hypothetical protein